MAEVEQKRDLGKRFLYLSLGFRQVERFETWNHYVWMQFWPCGSSLPACHHVGLSGGPDTSARIACRVAHSFALYTNNIALFQYCFHSRTRPRASQS